MICLLLVFLQVTPLPSCTAVSAGSCWRELFTRLSSHRVTLKQTNARTTLGKPGALEKLLCHFTLHSWCDVVIFICICKPLFFLLCYSFREFSSALEFLQLLNSCTEDSPSSAPPFSTPPNHTTTPGINSMKRTALFTRINESWITSDVCVGKRNRLSG